MTLTRDLLRSAAGLDAAPRRPRRPPLPLGILGVLLLAAGVTWLLLGLRDAAGVVRREANAARTELETFKSALKQGNTRGAAEHVAAARTHLTAADAAATRVQVRLIGLVPVLGWPADDLGHLLRAANLVTSSADDALRLYQDVGGKKPTLFARDRYDLAQLDRMSRTGNRLSRSLSGARREVEAVHAGVLAPAGVAEARDAALRQLGEFQPRIGELATALAVLPDAVGVRSPRSYLLAILNPAELRPSGGRR